MFFQNYLRLCNKHGISPSAAALEMGISKPTVTRWKKGGTPNDATLQRIADYFNVPVGYLVEDKNTKSLSTIGTNIVAAAGSVNSARRTLRNLYIDNEGVDAMLYGGYVWTDNALAQIAEALGCEVSFLKKEKAPDHVAEDLSADELEVVSILRKMSPEQLARELAYLRQMSEGEQGK